MNFDRNEKGNVLLLILVAIILFAALSYAITRTGNVGQDGGIEQLRIDTSQFLQYGTALSQAIKRLKTINGCMDDQINFDNSISPAGRYANPKAPIDGKCNVFTSQGAGVQIQTLNKKYKPTTGGSLYGRYIYSTGSSAGHALPLLGSDAQDIYLAIYFRSDKDNLSKFLSLCKEVNRINEIPVEPSNFEGLPAINASTVNQFFKGDFVNSGASNSGIELYNYTAFCAQNSGTHLRIAFPIMVR